MKLQLLRKSAPFTQYLEEVRYFSLATGLFITFLAKVDNDLEPEVKQFYCFTKKYERKCPFCFNNRMFTKEGDMLEILPYRSADGNNRGFS
ncbi:MAG: hypothetical protein IJ099_06530 [Alphaproteobacteria bacterium]|nr:hypothetical protein [Alphaproteobacteria bacterium]